MEGTSVDDASIRILKNQSATYNIDIRDQNGNLVESRNNVTVGGDGSTPEQIFTPIQKGYTYRVFKNIGHGHVTQCWSGTFS